MSHSSSTCDWNRTLPYTTAEHDQELLECIKAGLLASAAQGHFSHAGGCQFWAKKLEV